jgi:hypothetical protein
MVRDRSFRAAILLQHRAAVWGKGECFVKKRSIIALIAGGLLAAMLPGAAVAQTEAEGTVRFTDEGGTVMTLTFSNPQTRSGPFDGISVLNGSLVGNFATGTFEVNGTAWFAGEVEGCGPGSVAFDWSGGGTLDENGAPVWETNDYTSVPGGSLPITATIDEVNVDPETVNGDGTKTIAYSTTYSCDAAE